MPQAVSSGDVYKSEARWMRLHMSSHMRLERILEWLTAMYTHSQTGLGPQGFSIVECEATMQDLNSTAGQTNYRLAVLQPASSCVLAERHGGEIALPRISVPQSTRSVRQIQRIIGLQWGVSAAVLEFMSDGNGAPLCIAELLSPLTPSGLVVVPIAGLEDSEINSRESEVMQETASGDPGSRGPLSRVGWLNDAAMWIQANAGAGVELTGEIEQYNAGGGFALVRFISVDGSSFWIKAVGKPNLREFPVTKILASACPDSLPVLLAVRDEWNGWLMEGAGRPLDAVPSQELLDHAVSAMAKLQIMASLHVDSLLRAGARDHRAAVLQDETRRFVPFLDEAMQHQSTTKVPRIAASRLEEIGIIIEDACGVLASSGIPDTVVHNDLNSGNILFQRKHCRFIDWCEVSIGSPFLALQNLLRLAASGSVGGGYATDTLRRIYSECWMNVLTEKQLETGLALAPLVAVVSHLAGYLDFLSSPTQTDDRQLGYVRSLTRHLDRETHSPELRRILRG
jgi:hypothetical protein